MSFERLHLFIYIHITNKTPQVRQMQALIVQARPGDVRVRNQMRKLCCTRSTRTVWVLAAPAKSTLHNVIKWTQVSTQQALRSGEWYRLEMSE